MLSFRNSTSFIAVAALAVAIGMLVHARQTPNAIPHNAFAAAGLPIDTVAVKALEYWFPRASTYADEVANANHEGF